MEGLENKQTKKIKSISVSVWLVWLFFLCVGVKIYVMIKTIWILLTGMNNASSLWKLYECASLKLKIKSL